MGRSRILKIRVSLKGRPLKTYRFTKDEITVGRSPDSDIFLDNPGVSRTHVVFRRVSTGSYRVEDQGSANGTFVNDEQVGSEILVADDIVRVGKFSLWIEYETDPRRDPQTAESHVSPQACQGTTVLSTSELEDMLAGACARNRPSVRTRNQAAPAEAHVPRKLLGQPAGRIPVVVTLTAFAVGSLTGALVTWLIGR